MDSTATDARLRVIADRLREVCEAVDAAERRAAPVLATIPDAERPSAANLVHYLALRRFDARDLQLELARFGLSSLGRCEPHVRATLDAARRTTAELLRAAGCVAEQLPDEPSPIDFDRGESLTAERTAELLGPPAHPERHTRILVTMPPEASHPAKGPELLRRLLKAGMEAARINCAHDGEAAWEAMARNIRQAAADAHRPVRILCDIPGPKVRTTALPPGPAVVRWKPARDEFGRVVAPARIVLAPKQPGVKPDTLATTGPILGLPAEFLDRLNPGDAIRLKDTRGRQRTLRVAEPMTRGAWLAECWNTGYASPGTLLTLRDAAGEEASVEVSWTPRAEGSIRLAPGDRVLLWDAREEHPERLPPEIPRVGCTLPQAFADVRPGDHIWFDDGKLGATAESATSGYVLARVTHAPEQGACLRADKGINFPDSELRVSAVTAADREILRFVARHADLVGLSFVNRVQDIRDLTTELARLRPERRIGLVLKIETRRAFDNLPSLLLEAMRTPPVGVMIARGDLAIECGFERLAEVQEEILWMCEAAHVPTIWATQVLESMAKTGQPSRAEVTDAAMAERAECAMLNKGPYIVQAVRTLDDILQRMATHQRKKRAMLRPLRVARGFGAEDSQPRSAPAEV